MSTTPAQTTPRPVYAWWVILCLVGLDYFSSLAYFPTIAIQATGKLAPITGIGVVLVTLLFALPVYLYVIGRSPHGKGGVGLLEQRVHGWKGKLLLLIMLGFVATDFVLTRTLSVSDAAVHITENPWYSARSGWVGVARDSVAQVLPKPLVDPFKAFWSEQLILTIVLSVVAFGLYFYMIRTLSRGFVSLAFGVVALYLVLNAIVITSGIQYLMKYPDLVRTWEASIRPEIGDFREKAGNVFVMIIWLSILSFPPLAIGLSGFELTMAAAPSIRGGVNDDPEHPQGRIFRTRLLMVVAAVIMCVYVLGANTVVPLLIPKGALGEGDAIKHRALSYLAHGMTINQGGFETTINPIFGPAFGTLYDISTILILILAGAGATISMREIVPDFLSRFGMQMEWARRIGVITHLFNIVMLVVTLYFRASVSAQLWAYAASVLALLFGAALAATLDVKKQLEGWSVRWLISLPFLLSTILFGLMGVLIVIQRFSGMGIALVFVAVVLITAIVSRYIRSTEMRFDGFEFADDATRDRWEEVCKLEFQVLVPHDPTGHTLPQKEDEIRERHRISGEVPIIFIEVHLGDPSEFTQRPLMEILDGDRMVIRVSRCNSIAHVLAAIGLAFRDVGFPPEFHFGWSNKSPMAANIDFLLLGQGNVPWMVHGLMLKVEPREERRPRVIVG